MARVALGLDGSVLETPRTAELVPGRVLLHDTADGLMPEQGPLDAAMLAALRLLDGAEARVDLDIAMHRPGGEWRVHSWQGVRDGRVATLSTVDGRTYELSWLGDDGWRLELARAATVQVTARGSGAAPALPGVLDLTYELLLATGDALRRGRFDLVAELGRRLGGDLRIDDAPGAGDHTALLTALHAGVVGRLQALVRCPGSGAAGRVNWLHHGDGWRQLTPYSRDGERRVRIAVVDEFRLGVEVAGLLTRLGFGRVRAGSSDE